MAERSYRECIDFSFCFDSLNLLRGSPAAVDLPDTPPSSFSSLMPSVPSK